MNEVKYLENNVFNDNEIEDGANIKMSTEYSASTVSNDNDIDDDVSNKMSTELKESENILLSSESNETTNSEISSKKIIQVVNMEISESVGGGHCWTPTEKEKISSKLKSVLIEEPVSLIIPGMIPKNSQVLISDGPHNTPSETEDHEAVISSKVTLSLIPVSKIIVQCSF
jgi:hypothetical protein